MTDTARDFQQPEPTDTEGLDDLFQSYENQNEADDSQVILTDASLILTVSEASLHLGMPVSTLYRRIRAGKFETTTGDDGAMRIILPGDNHDENHVIIASPPDENEKPEVILDDSHDENHPSSDLDRLLELIAEKDRKLEAATYRVGFLESQLSERLRDIEERDASIKLLTDSQHNKTSWWSRFKAWLRG